MEPRQAVLFVDHGKRPLLPTFIVELEQTSFVLTQEGRQVKMSDATEMVLAPILFPDLPQRFSATGETNPQEANNSAKSQT